MAARRPGIPNRPYTAAEVERAVRMSIKGESDPEIARTIGRSAPSVREKLDRIGLPGLRCNGQSHGLRLCVPNAAYAKLVDEAQRRQATPEQLAAQALTTLAREPNMLVNILDWAK